MLDDHLRVLAQGLADVRGLVAYLRAKGVRELGAFGDSFGAWLITEAKSMDGGIDFATLFIPIVSFADFLFRSSELAPLRARLAASGFDLARLAALCRELDTRSSIPALGGERVSILHGAFDLVAAPELALDLARAFGTTRTHEYARGRTSSLSAPGSAPTTGDELARPTRGGNLFGAQPPSSLAALAKPRSRAKRP